MYAPVPTPARVARKQDDTLQTKNETRARAKHLGRTLRAVERDAAVRAWVLRRRPEHIFEPTGAKRQQYAEWFDVMDADGSGAVEREEIEELCASLRITISPATMRAMFSAAGKGVHESLSRSEFLKVMHRFEGQFEAEGGGDPGQREAGDGAEEDVSLSFLAARRAAYLNGVIDPQRRARAVADVREALDRRRPATPGALEAALMGAGKAAGGK
mmetsp:Transcript_20016/g.67279  ORF Transcript_20016/g.67279 Transcript_20016/m.67279 type:complete len:215 (+) Transcript_20016:235-879(+)